MSREFCLKLIPRHKGTHLAPCLAQAGVERMSASQLAGVGLSFVWGVGVGGEGKSERRGGGPRARVDNHG